MVEDIKKELRKYINLDDEPFMKRVFGVNPGNYAEKDKLLCVKSAGIKATINKYWKEVILEDTQELLHSEYHEDRAVALGILVKKYQKEKTIEGKKEIVDIYLNNTQYINNWDLVDTTVEKIIGNYCYTINDEKIIRKLAKSKNMWEVRMSIIAAETYVKKGQLDLMLELCTMHLEYPYHLINKAVGWMLREVGKQNEEVLINFLENNINIIPNVTFSYATEKLSKEDKDKLKTLKVKRKKE